MQSSSLGRSEYLAVLDDLQARKVQIEAAIAVIKNLLESPGFGASLPAGPQSGGAGSTIKPGDLAELSITDAAKRFLGVQKRPCTTAEIAEGLKRGAHPSAASATFGNTVGAILGRANSNASSGIQRVGRGTWGLSAWSRTTPSQST